MSKKTLSEMTAAPATVHGYDLYPLDLDDFGIILEKVKAKIRDNMKLLLEALSDKDERQTLIRDTQKRLDSIDLNDVFMSSPDFDSYIRTQDGYLSVIAMSISKGNGSLPVSEYVTQLKSGIGADAAIEMLDVISELSGFSSQSQKKTPVVIKKKRR